MPEETILDSAFALIKQGRFGQAHRGANATLHDQYPSATLLEIQDALRRANELADACYDAGDQLVGHWDREPAILASLEQRFPGFSEKTYDSALGWGVFMAR